jgi:hypothetical protein
MLGRQGAAAEGDRLKMSVIAGFSLVFEYFYVILRILLTAW